MTYQEMLEVIEKANKAYYDNDNPIMTDYEYDMLMQQVKAYEAEHPEVVTSDSPTQHVGGSEGKSEFAKITHPVPMLSLEDIFSTDGMASRMAAARESLGVREDCYTVEPKIDGLSVALEYIDGVFTRGATRGNGLVGEDVTENLKQIKSIPMTLPHYPHRLIVRGEVFMPKTVLEELNAAREAAGEPLFANTRNAAAGALRQKDPAKTAERKLDIYIFNLQLAEGNGFAYETHAESLDALDRAGFPVIPHKLARTAEEVKAEIAAINEMRPNYPCDIDGAVVKVNSLYHRRMLGETTKTPRWAWAFKYPPEEKETTVKDIFLQTGRTGKITPVALFDPPLYLAGTKVEKASLHNQNILSRLGVNIGDTVVVRKAAEIIPEVVCVSRHGEGEWKEYNITEHACPSCGGRITNNADQTEQFCTNPNCPAQLMRSLEFFASRDVMDIRGLGPNLVELFIARGWLKSLPDIYKLKDHRAEMEQLEGMGPKQVEKLLNAIEASKNNDIDRLIKGFGIPGVGRHIGKELARKYTSIWEIGNLNISDLAQLEGVGEISATEIVKYFHEPGNIALLKELYSAGVNFHSRSYSDPSSAATSAPLSNLTFVITGTLPTMKREDAAAMIEKNGGKVSGSVSKKTSYLLAGEAAGSKLDKAKALNIPVITEAELLAMFR